MVQQVGERALSCPCEKDTALADTRLTRRREGDAGRSCEAGARFPFYV